MIPDSSVLFFIKNQTNKTPENFKDICKNSDSNTASSPRSALRATAAAQSKLCKVLPVAVAALCLTESKEQAENYRQGEVPGWYYTNPCWDNNLCWRLAESPEFNFGTEGSVNNIVEWVKTCLTIACQKVNVRSKENWKDVLSYFFSPKSAMETSWLHKTCAALLGRQPPVSPRRKIPFPSHCLTCVLVWFYVFFLFFSFLFESMVPNT